MSISDIINLIPGTGNPSVRFGAQEDYILSINSGKFRSSATGTSFFLKHLFLPHCWWETRSECRWGNGSGIGRSLGRRCIISGRFGVETDDLVLIAGVWPLQKNKPDRPFDDQINDVRCCLSHLDDFLMMRARTLMSACGSRYGFWVGCSSHWNGICVWVEEFLRLSRLRRPWRERRRYLEPAVEILWISVWIWTGQQDMFEKKGTVVPM